MDDWDNLVEPTRGALEALISKGDAMADRIEELEALYAAAKHDAQEAEAYAEELEAKLAKAVVFAEIVERAGHGALWPLALDILAELKGQNDD